MIAEMKGTLNNEKGFVLVLVILVLALVTMIGIAVTRTSDTEMNIAVNERLRVREFYDAEGGLIDILERATTSLPAAIWNPAGSDGWLSDNFLNQGMAAKFQSNADLNEDGKADARVEIRCIESSGTSIAGLSDAANSFPVQSHIAPPPAGSGYSARHFEVRRYAVTSTSTSGNTQLQTGAWKIFNRF